MNNTTPTIADKRIAKVLEELDAAGDNQISTLTEGDPFWQHPDTPVIREASELISEERVAELKEELANGCLVNTGIVDLYAVDGSIVDKRTVPGYSEALNEVRYSLFHQPNAVQRFRDHILVFRGMYRLVETTIGTDGEDAFKFVSESSIILEEKSEFEKTWLPIVLANRPSWSEEHANTPTDGWDINFEIDGTFRVTFTSRNVFDATNLECSKAIAYLSTTMAWNRKTRELVSREPVSAYVHVEEGKLNQPLHPKDIETIADGLRLFADQYRDALGEESSR